MNTVKLTYASGNESISLDYTLQTGYTVVHKWLAIWNEYYNRREYQPTFTINSECPSTVLPIEDYHNVVLENCKKLVTVYNKTLPDGWDSVPYAQSLLNVIHDKFAAECIELGELSEGDYDPELLALLRELNHNIHTLEGAINNNGTLQNYARSVLLEPWHVVHSDQSIEDWPKSAALLTQQDQDAKSSGFAHRHCLFLAYATLGKDIEMILQDNHLDLITANNVEPKRSVSPWFTFNIPAEGVTAERESELTHGRLEWYKEKSQEHDLVGTYGVDINDWIHAPGRHILAINESGSADDFDWFVERAHTCKIVKIDFDTEILNASVVYDEDADTYSWSND